MLLMAQMLIPSGSDFKTFDAFLQTGLAGNLVRFVSRPQGAFAGCGFTGIQIT